MYQSLEWSSSHRESDGAKRKDLSQSSSFAPSEFHSTPLTSFHFTYRMLRPPLPSHRSPLFFCHSWVASELALAQLGAAKTCARLLKVLHRQSSLLTCAQRQRAHLWHRIGASWSWWPAYGCHMSLASDPILCFFKSLCGVVQGRRVATFML